MTFGVTSEGFKAKKFDDIVTDLATQLDTQLGIDINSDPDSVAKVFTNIISLALADEWALPQAMQSMFDIDKAEGKHLDDLVGYVGMTRLGAAGSYGDIYITANQVLTIPSGSEFLDVDGNTFQNPSTLTVSGSDCVSLILGGNLSFPSEAFSVVINGVNITRSLSEISEMPLLANDINNSSQSSRVFATGTVEGVLSIVALTDIDSQTITYTSNFSLGEVISKTNLVRDEVGAFAVPADTVTVAPNITGIQDTTNRYDFTLGREKETDEDLRNRHALSLSTAGAGTVEAIRADLLDVPFR